MYSCVLRVESAGIYLNWARTNLREEAKQLSSQYDKDHLRASLYFGRVIIFQKEIIFVQENIFGGDDGDNYDCGNNKTTTTKRQR